MPTQTNKQPLEAAIQEKLSGLALEEINEKYPAANVAERSKRYNFIKEIGEIK